MAKRANKKTVSDELLEELEEVRKEFDAAKLEKTTAQSVLKSATEKENIAWEKFSQVLIKIAEYEKRKGAQD